MDYGFVYALVLVTIIIAGAAGIYHVKKGKLTTEDELKIVENVFDLTTSIIDELNLPSEKAILRIAQIVRSALDYAIATIGDHVTEAEVKEASKQYAFDLCEQFNLELTDTRKLIIGQLINAGLSSIYSFDERVGCYKKMK